MDLVRVKPVNPLHLKSEVAPYYHLFTGTGAGQVVLAGTATKRMVVHKLLLNIGDAAGGVAIVHWDNGVAAANNVLAALQCDTWGGLSLDFDPWGIYWSANGIGLKIDITTAILVHLWFAYSLSD